MYPKRENYNAEPIDRYHGGRLEMLAGQAQSMETHVFKAKTVSKLWAEYPLVFRVFMLPAVLLSVLQHRLEGEEFVFVVLGPAGEELELTNKHLAVTSDDPPDMELIAYVSNSSLKIATYDGLLRNGVMTALSVLQAAVWCVQGENISMVVTGDVGGSLPEWAWEFVRQGPEINQVRLKAFNESGGDAGGSGGSRGPPTGRPGR